jgi:hypothetical protein
LLEEQDLTGSLVADPGFLNVLCNLLKKGKISKVISRSDIIFYVHVVGHDNPENHPVKPSEGQDHFLMFSEMILPIPIRVTIAVRLEWPLRHGCYLERQDYLLKLIVPTK